MRIRLTQISLRHKGRDFPEGAVLVGGKDIPLELAQARLDAESAVLVDEDGGVELPADVARALETWAGTLDAAAASFVALVDLVDGLGDQAGPSVVAMEAVINDRVMTQTAVGLRMMEISERVAAYRLSLRGSSAVEHLAHNQGDAGSNPAPAPNSEEAAGANGEASEHRASATGETDAHSGDEGAAASAAAPEAPAKPLTRAEKRALAAAAKAQGAGSNG